MKKISIFSTIAVALSISACTNSSTTENEQKENVSQNIIDTTQLKPGETYYQCPMHPEEISDKEGSCSKCKMYLEKVEKK